MSSSVRRHPVIFYNVENLYDVHDDPKTADTEFTPDGDKQWTEKRYHQKLEHLANVISSISTRSAVIVGLAEVENRGVVEDLIRQEELQSVNYRIVHQDSPDNRGIDLCLLYDADRVEYISEQFLRINFPWNRDIKTRDIIFFECKLEGEHFWFVLNHWPSRRKGAKETEGKRLHVAKEVRRRVRSIMQKDPNAKIVVMGDFNDEPNDRSIHQVLKAKRDKNIKEDEFFNLHAEADDHHKGTSSHMGEWLMIDQIMINRNFLQNRNSGLSVHKNKGKIFEQDGVLFCRPNGNCKPNQTYGGDHYLGGISDHLPVYFTFDN